MRFNWILCGPLLTAPAIAAIAASPVDFQRDIEPIFKARCLDCHGAEKQKSKFRLDQRAYLLRGGNSGLAAVVPGKLKNSYLVELLKETDPDDRMPAKGKPLTARDIALVEQWIAEGAHWPGQEDAVIEVPGADHWSLQPVKRPDLPLKTRHPVDAFLTKKLKDANLSPNPPATPRSLIRRVSIVLTGLPPTPQRVAQFEQAFRRDPDAAYVK
ncbi:MAG: DUF1549 domain-containing protein, partial [Phycisphaerae bacterium]|nr:DUF1549 domain-containing protein [Phycisphaerae bacterium]